MPGLCSEGKDKVGHALKFSRSLSLHNIVFNRFNRLSPLQLFESWNTYWTCESTCAQRLLWNKKFDKRPEGNFLMVHCHTAGRISLGSSALAWPLSSTITLIKAGFKRWARDLTEQTVYIFPAAPVRRPVTPERSLFLFLLFDTISTNNHLSGWSEAIQNGVDSSKHCCL